MRVYLSQSEPEDRSFQHFANVSAFARGVMASEATHIICDGFLSSFAYGDLEAVAKMIFQKMRIGCELSIIEPDFYLISKHIFNESVAIEQVNAAVFKSGNLRSILTMEAIVELLDEQPNLEIVSKHFDEALCRSIVKVRRSE